MKLDNLILLTKLSIFDEVKQLDKKLLKRLLNEDIATLTKRASYLESIIDQNHTQPLFRYIIQNALLYTIKALELKSLLKIDEYGIERHKKHRIFCDKEINGYIVMFCAECKRTLLSDSIEDTLDLSKVFSNGRK